MHQKNRHVVAGALLLALSVAVNVLQAQRIKALIEPEVVDTLVGTTPSPIEGWSLEGEPVRLVPGENQTTVLYYFSSTCSWCERNWQNIQRLVAASDGRYRVVGLSAERGLREFAKERGLEMQIVEGVSAETVQQYQFTATPHTVVVDLSGTIAQSWRGVFSPTRQRQAEELFGVTLPGLSQASSGQSTER